MVENQAGERPLARREVQVAFQFQDVAHEGVFRRDNRHTPQAKIPDGAAGLGRAFEEMPFEFVDQASHPFANGFEIRAGGPGVQILPVFRLG